MLNFVQHLKEQPLALPHNQYTLFHHIVHAIDMTSLDMSALLVTVNITRCCSLFSTPTLLSLFSSVWQEGIGFCIKKHWKAAVKHRLITLCKVRFNHTPLLLTRVQFINPLWQISSALPPCNSVKIILKSNSVRSSMYFSYLLHTLLSVLAHFLSILPGCHKWHPCFMASKKAS